MNLDDMINLISASIIEPTQEEMNEQALREYNQVSPYMIDMWPDKIKELSMPTKMIKIDNIEEFIKIYEFDDMQLNKKIIKKYSDILDKEMNGKTYFIRGNSRSPKDASYPNMPITNSGAQAIEWICSSMRIMDDLFAPRNAQTPFYICLREYLDIKIENEFRCYAKNGKLLAVSRYDYENENKINNITKDVIWDKANHFYNENLKEYYNDVVFDIADMQSEKLLLIEINPYGLSDPCLFKSYENIENNGGVLI